MGSTQTALVAFAGLCFRPIAFGDDSCAGEEIDDGFPLGLRVGEQGGLHAAERERESDVVRAAEL